MAQTGDGAGQLHVPQTTAGGVFVGEAGTSLVQQPFVVLDDGVVRGFPDLTGVDHDARVLRRRQVVTTNPLPLDPPALPFRREPVPEDWATLDGEASSVQEREGGMRTTRYFDELLFYDGHEGQEEVHTDSQPRAVFDFRWTFDETLEAGQFCALSLTIRDTPDTSAATAEQHLQGQVEGWLDGDRRAGWVNTGSGYATEVVEVLEREPPNAPEGQATRTRVTA